MLPATEVKAETLASFSTLAADGVPWGDWWEAKGQGRRQTIVAGYGQSGIFSRAHSIQPGLPGINYQNVDGWSNPICLHAGAPLSDAQLVKSLAEPIHRFVAPETRMSPAAEFGWKLKSKRFDYMGNPVEHMENLVADKVVKAWPTPGNAAVVDLKACLPDEFASKLDDPHSFLIPKVDLPERRRGSKVWATEDEWFKVIKAGLFAVVDDKDIPANRRGVAITILYPVNDA